VSAWRNALARTLRVAALAAERQRTLPLTLQHQLQTNWCWAACTVSTSAFFNATSTWGQCGLVSAEVGLATCCADGSSEGCNRPWRLDSALQRTGNLASMAAGTANWDTITGEIDAGRPVAARVAWAGGGAHFVMLTGYRRKGDGGELEVQDPWTGSSLVPLDVFATSYKGSGTWTHTYLTRR